VLILSGAISRIKCSLWWNLLKICITQLLVVCSLHVPKMYVGLTLAGPPCKYFNFLPTIFETITVCRYSIIHWNVHVLRWQVDVSLQIAQYSATTCFRWSGNPYKLLVNHCRINVRKHFSERIIRVWNSLPPSIVSFKSLLSFRNSLRNVNLSLYTKYWSLFFKILFLLSVCLVFSPRLILCVLLLYACFCRLCD